MTDVPSPLGGNHPLTGWLNKLRQAVINRTPRSVPTAHLAKSTKGFTSKPVVNKTDSAQTTAEVSTIREWSSGISLAKADLVFRVNTTTVTGADIGIRYIFQWIDDATTTSPDPFDIAYDARWEFIGFGPHPNGGNPAGATATMDFRMSDGTSATLLIQQGLVIFIQNNTGH